MTYQEAIYFLENLQKFGDEPGLMRMSKMLAALGNPHKKLKYVHVTGTNGKGSTSASVASVLLASGYNVGLFTSPHLYKYNERIKVNNTDISDNDFIRQLEKVKTVLQENPDIKPALFEAITVMAFLYFSEQNIDIAILEVGIGGRVDSTNIIDGLVSVITNIDLEHTEVLGNTKEEIAFEKAGIIKQNATAITTEQDTKVQQVFRAEAEKQQAKLQIINPGDIQLKQQSIKGQIFDFRNHKNVEIPLLGKHQLFNTSTAILVAEALKEKGFDKITDKTIKTGLKNVKWPLRLEIVHEHPAILIDVVHNLHGVKAIKQAVEETFQEFEKVLILACSYNKPYQEMAKELSELSDTIILTKANYHATETEEIAKSIDATKKTIYQTSNVQEALLKAKELTRPDQLLMVLGSLYMGAEAREKINEIFDTVQSV